MKLINQSFEILEQKDFTLKGIKQFIERCGRVCYKSEDKITDTSYEKFVDMLEKRDHARPLEFGTVHLKMPWSNFNNFVGFCISKAIWDSCWIKYYIDIDSENKMVYITTNYRYYKKLKSLKSLYGYINIEDFFTEEDNEYYPKRYTVHFITSRGIMDEFRTHVGLSHLAESTRYCNYSKDKFDNQVTFVIPSWCELLIKESKQKDSPFKINGDEVVLIGALKSAQNSYIYLLKLGYTPQQARDVLPLSVKSELISCGFKDAWNNFFYRRCDNAAHPMARELACGLKEEFIKRNYINCKKS